MMRGMNMQQMMKQAKKMQQKMMEEQQNLAKEEFIGVSPDEMVKATFTGDKKLTDLQIDPQAVDPDDVDMLADLVWQPLMMAWKSRCRHAAKIRQVH